MAHARYANEMIGPAGGYVRTETGADRAMKKRLKKEE